MFIVISTLRGKEHYGMPRTVEGMHYRQVFTSICHFSMSLFLMEFTKGDADLSFGEGSKVAVYFISFYFSFFICLLMLTKVKQLSLARLASNCINMQFSTRGHYFSVFQLDELH